jgi:hypothetical protein
MLEQMGLMLGDQLGKGTAGLVHRAVKAPASEGSRDWRGPRQVGDPERWAN